MVVSDKEMQVYIHKLSDMKSFNKEDIEKIKKMDVKDLLKIIITLNIMFKNIIEILEEHIFN